MPRSQATPIPPTEARALCRAVEDLRAPYHALLMASSGIAAALHAGTTTEDGVFWLLEAVGKQLDAAIAQLEAITAPGAA